MKRIWGITAVALLALTGCASTSSPAAPTVSSSAPARSPSVAEPAESKIVESICKDSTEDGENGVDLAQARLLSDGTLLFVEYELAGDLPDTGRVFYSVMASSADGGNSYQLGTTFQDGVESDNFIFNSGTATQKNITNGAVAADGTVSVRYPLADVEGLGEEFRWAANVSVEGTDVDRCPDGDGLDGSKIEDEEWNVHANS